DGVQGVAMSDRPVRVVSIVGLGLIGGSFGLALQRAPREGRARPRLLGWTRSAESRELAEKMRVVDEVRADLISTVKEADVVVVSTPVLAMQEIFQAIAPHLAPGSVVTDVASTKAQVMAWAEDCLPKEVDFVGGHPMAGKVDGLEAAEASLFDNCTYCLTPSSGVREESVVRIVALVEAVGGRPYFVDPIEHDGFVAAVSHLPFLLSTALVEAVTSSPSWPELRKVASSGFRDTSRLASGDPLMYRDICLSNRDAILRWLDEYLRCLTDLREMVAERQAEELRASFAKAKEARDDWWESRQPK
ncbi:MAG: prephenate dehydrogenase, partial [Chloroflexi bacterium]|nr:prephenate dehydrogenase [Chloroflexota bacterium]